MCKVFIAFLFFFYLLSWYLEFILQAPSKVYKHTMPKLDCFRFQFCVFNKHLCDTTPGSCKCHLILVTSLSGVGEGGEKCQLILTEHSLCAQPSFNPHYLLWGRFQDYPHFTDEEMDLFLPKITQLVNSKKDLNPDGLTSEFYHRSSPKCQSTKLNTHQVKHVYISSIWEMLVYIHRKHVQRYSSTALCVISKIQTKPKSFNKRMNK